MAQSNYDITEQHRSFVISYIQLRRAIGVLGIVLPMVLVIGFSIARPDCILPPSISHYYYTLMGSYFTGTLCAVGLFLFSYNGPALVDRRAAWLAAVAAITVAFFPTAPYCSSCGQCVQVIAKGYKWVDTIHYSAATLLFLCFAFFSLVLFTKSDPAKNKTARKKKRNVVYVICGYTILACMAAIALLQVMGVAELPLLQNFTQSTFVLEAIALFAFGFSWLVKGETIWRDKK
jgi:hypothetical protein